MDSHYTPHAIPCAFMLLMEHKSGDIMLQFFIQWAKWQKFSIKCVHYIPSFLKPYDRFVRNTPKYKITFYNKMY